jgi:hypothetical protein
MSLLFVDVTGGGWALAPLVDPVYALRSTTPPLEAVDAPGHAQDAPATLCRLSPATPAARWALLAADTAAVYVNGSPLPLGLRVLLHKDEVRIGDQHFYFSAERLPQVEPFPVLGRPVACGRCGGALRPSMPAVSCPSCGTWSHSSTDLPCWRYDPTCPRCDQRTDADDYTWSPACL